MNKTKKSSIRLGGSFSWEERAAIVKEYLSGHYTKVEIWRKYTGQDQEHGQLLRWMRTLGYISDESSMAVKRKWLASPLQRHETLDTTPKNSDKDPVGLQQRIKALEKALETAQLKVEGYELMMELAEKAFNIPIRKKFATQ